MSFTVPNLPTASFPTQAKVTSQDFLILADAVHGNGVVIGSGNECNISQRAAGANMSLDVADGTIVFEGATVSVAAGNVLVPTADGVNPRVDLLSVTGAGVKTLTAGVAASSPLPPTIPQSGGINNVVLAFVYVPATDTAITNLQITDKRVGVNTPGGASVPNDSVTYAKMQNISAASRLLGRGSAAGSGDPQEIVLGTNLSMSGTTLNATGGAGSGDVVGPAASTDGEVALYSGVTGKLLKRSNTLTGPARLTSGVLGTGNTNLASEVTGDLPLANVTPATAASRLLGRGSAAGAGDFQEITLGANLTMTGTSLAASGGGTTPTGTGFTHVTGGAQDAAAKLVDTADINNDQITFPKMQNVSAASKLLGRGSAAGAGDPEEITLGTNLTMAGTTLNASAASGAPTTADYLVRTSDAGLSAERVVTDTATVTWDWSVAGQAKANATGGGGSSDIIAVVAADVPHATNSTTLSNITGLTFNTTASPTEAWVLDITLLINTNVSGGSAADLKFGWTVSGGQTGNWGGTPELLIGGISVLPVMFPTLATPLIYGGSTVTVHCLRLHAIIASNGSAGAVQLQFAQNVTAAGTIVTVKKHSHFFARKLVA